jgi:hypothetical protein
MGLVMVRCPNTHRPISTEIIADKESFYGTPVFFSQIWCPLCRMAHEWFAKDAWVCDSVPVCNLDVNNCNCEQQAA